MAEVPELYKLQQQYEDVAKFTYVYQSEAHASNSWWPFGEYKMAEHESLEDRWNACKVFIEDLQRCELLHEDEDEDEHEDDGRSGTSADSVKEYNVYMDGMNNAVMRAFCSYPDRMYVVRGKKEGAAIIYKGWPGPFGFKTKYLAGVLEGLAGGGTKES